MTVIKDLNTIVLNHIDYYRTNQPDADIKPGEVFRDVFIDCPSVQLSLVYQQMSTLQGRSSVKNYFGKDLEDFLMPYGYRRAKATPASGLVVLTFSDLSAPIALRNGATVSAKNGINYGLTATKYIDPASANYYKSIAQKYANDLSYLGITDPYAIEVLCKATTDGTIGSVSKYGINTVAITGVNNVFNPNTMTGVDAQSDSNLQNQYISNQGSIAGTSMGLYNVVTALSGSLDAYVVEAGDPLMTRDGTIVETSTDGTKTIISEGTGGKTDVIVLGENLQQGLDTFIYKDKSNKNDATNPKNNYVLGQIAADVNKAIIAKRKRNLQNSSLPSQPVSNIVQVSGSSSGANFIQKSVDQYGRVSGNYDLVKDTSNYAGTPWGFDTFVWISNQCSISEDKNKGIYNGQDGLNFTGSIEISDVTQNLLIANENSTVLSDNSLIKLLHTPISNVSRVFNATTGELYSIVALNMNTDKLNTSGIIQIKGSTLPAPTDTLQVDYNWVVSYDPMMEFDGKVGTKNVRDVNDSVDWGYSNAVSEVINFTANSNMLTGYASHVVDSIVSINQYTSLYGRVSLGTGLYSGRLTTSIQLAGTIGAINSITIENTSIEVFNTDNNDAFVSFDANTNILFIVLPTDVGIANNTILVQVGEMVVVRTNKVDLTSFATSNKNAIYVPGSSNASLEVKYLCDSKQSLNTNVRSLNSYRNGNGFVYSYALPKNVTPSSPSNIYRTTISREYQSVKIDGSFNAYINFNPDTTNYAIKNVLSVTRVSDGKSLGVGSTSVIAGQHTLYLTQNIPVLNDVVLVCYELTNMTTCQPYTARFNALINRIETIPQNTHITSIPMFMAFAEASVSATLYNDNLGTSLAITGAIVPGSGIGVFTSSSSIANLLSYTRLVIASPLNAGEYRILSTSSSPTINYTKSLSHISSEHVSVIDVATGAELWSSSNTISGNSLNIALSNNTTSNRYIQVLIGQYHHLRASANKYIATLSDQVNQQGSVKILGMTLLKCSYVSNAISSTTSGLKLNLSSLIAQGLVDNGYSPATQCGIAKIASLSSVNAVDQEIVNTLFDYDVINSKLRFNCFNDNVQEDTSLQSFETILPSSNRNKQNIPYNGQTFHVSFYIYIPNDVEIVNFTKNGTLYTNKRFITTDSVQSISGFTKTNSANIVVSPLTQPTSNARYTAKYSYVAPKQNERISITYNYNNLITSATLAVDNLHHPNDDILVKAASAISVDITAYVIVLDTYADSANTILQNVYNTIVNSATLTSLGAILDQSDVSTAVGNVAGVDSIRITHFNISGNAGSVSSIKCQKNQYISAGVVQVLPENR